MTITDICELTGSKYKIFIDEEFAFVLYKGELRQFGIKIGEEISEEDYCMITGEVLTKRAKLRAMHLLEKKPYTEMALRTKLSENFYSESIIDATIDYLKGFGYIDDCAYATQYLETYSGSKSVRKMEMELRQKGITADIFDKAYETCEALGELTDEHVLVAKLLDKKHFGESEPDEQTIAKVANFLYGKGFSSEIIREEMKKKMNL